MKMKHLKVILAIALVAMSLFAVTLPAMAGTLTHTAGTNSEKYLYNIAGRTTAPIFSIRVANTPVGNTANVRLNLNDSLGSTYFLKSNTIGVSGGMTEKFLTDSSTFWFNPKISDKAQIELLTTNGTVTINFSMTN
jgi:hypothetical protein